MNIIFDTLPFSLSALAVLALAHKILPPFKSFLDYSHSIYQDSSQCESSSARPVTCYNHFSISLARKLVLYQLVLNAIIYTTLTSAIITVELVLCEIGDWLSADARVVVWKLATTTLISMLVVAVPLLEIFTIIYTSQIRIISKIKYPVIVALFSLWLLMFYYLGLFIPLPPPEPIQNSVADAARSFASYYYNYYASNSRSFYEETLSRIVVIGVCAMAVLSGFAAVSTPYTLFFAKRKPVDLFDIELVNRSLETTTDLLESKNEQFQDVQGKLRARASMSSTSLHSIMMSIRAAATGGDDLTHEKTGLSMEIDGLEKMKDSLENDLRTLKNTYQEQQYDKTPMGKLWKKAYMAFAVYCIYRLFTVLFLRNPIQRASNILFMALNAKSGTRTFANAQESIAELTASTISATSTSSSNPDSLAQSDALANTLAHIFVKIHPSADVNAWTRQIGFILSGFLFLGSISSAITTFNSLTKAFPLLQIEPHLQFIKFKSHKSHSSHSHEKYPHEKHVYHSYPSAHSPSSSLSISSGSNTASSVPSIASSSSAASFFSYPSFSLLVISQFLGIYILSTSLLLRSNLPHELSSAITSALGTPLDTYFVESLFDTVFAIVALASLTGIWFAERLGSRSFVGAGGLGMGADEMASYGFFDEEKMLDASKLN